MHQHVCPYQNNLLLSVSTTTMHIEFTTPILKLDDAILRRLTTFIITPDWDAPFNTKHDRGPQPDFPSFFALSQTCRSLRLSLVRPDEDDGYWRSVLLDVGQGRPCPQAPLKFHFGSVEIPFDDEDSSWAAIARRLAKEVHDKSHSRSYLGRGRVRPVLEESGDSSYYAASREKHVRLPGVPSPEVHRLLSPGEVSTYSVPINYEAVAAGRDFLDTASGTFFTRPAVPEIKVFLTFDEHSAWLMTKLCRRMRFLISGLTNHLGVHLLKSGLPSNCILNPDKPVVIRNPHGVTTNDVASTLRTWLSRVHPLGPMLELCVGVVAFIAYALEEVRPPGFKAEELIRFSWLSMDFARPERRPEEGMRDDWQFLLVNGGVTFVRVTLMVDELMARVRAILPPVGPFDMLSGGAHFTVHLPIAPDQTESPAPTQPQSQAAAQDPPHLVPEDVD